MIYRVSFRVRYIDVWKDFTTLFDAANYASEIRGTVCEKGELIHMLRIEFIEKEEEKEEEEEENPADANQ